MATDHDILIELQRDVCWIKKNLSNHLKHHWMLTIALCTVTVGGIVTWVITLIR